MIDNTIECHMDRRCTHNAGLALQWLRSVMQLQSSLCLNVYITYMCLYIYVHTYIQHADAQEPLATQKPRDPKQPKKPLRSQGTLFRGWCTTRRPQKPTVSPWAKNSDAYSSPEAVLGMVYDGYGTATNSHTMYICIYIYIWNAQAM